MQGGTSPFNLEGGLGLLTARARRFLICSILMLAIASNFDTALADASTDFILSEGGSVTRVEPDWIVTCIGGKKDALGAVPTPSHCRLEKHNMTALVIVTKRGYRVELKPTISPCNVRTAIVAVDKSQIQNKPVKSQLAILRKGKTFARSYQSSWPECWYSTEETSLYGIGAALDILARDWALYSAGLR